MQQLLNAIPVRVDYGRNYDVEWVQIGSCLFLGFVTRNLKQRRN